jgi:hypothetical protein
VTETGIKLGSRELERDTDDRDAHEHLGDQVPEGAYFAYAAQLRLTQGIAADSSHSDPKETGETRGGSGAWPCA